MVVALAAPLIVHFSDIKSTLLLLSALLLVLDGMRTMENTLLNAARRQKTSALITICEAWGRPLLAIVALQFLGVSLESLFIGYSSLSSFLLLAFYLFGKPAGTERNALQPINKEQIEQLRRKLYKYTLPLLPMASLDWLSGQGDRYMIGMLLGLDSAGIYSAIYGLMSRPFLMLSGIVETTLRPVYNQYIVSGNHQSAKQLIIKWVALVIAVSSLGVITVTYLNTFIVNLLLAEKYRRAYQLVPWIAGGYALLMLSRIFEIICYAYSKTSFVLLIEVIGAAVSIVIGYIGIINFGLIGAAMAIPVYFGLKLLLSIYCARSVMKQNRMEFVVVGHSAEKGRA
jgi:O-antigen/teichoic acid export membrane protein